MLSKDATFGDLADQLERFGKRRQCKPVPIEVKLAAAFDALQRRLDPGSALGRGIGIATPKGARYKYEHKYRPSDFLNLTYERRGDHIIETLVSKTIAGPDGYSTPIARIEPNPLSP
jgi:hypothetical protein